MTKRTKSQIKNSVRYLAMKILVNVEQQQSYINLQLTHILNDTQLLEKDSALLTEIVYGVTQRKLTLDYLLEPYIKKSIPLWLRTILRLSVFQLLFLDRIPQYAIVNEASEIARIKSGQSIVNFVNGVLRNVIRHGHEQLEQLNNLPLSQRAISIQTSMPMWLVVLLSHQYGLETTKQIGYSLLEKPKLSIRVINEKVMPILKEQYNAQISCISPVAMRLSSGHILNSPLFYNGDITIQDESSTLVAQTVDIQPNDYILDTCAAPGGKVTHIASLLDKQSGQVIALDLYEHKLKLIEQNAMRLHVNDRIKTMKLDAQTVHQIFDKESFDVVFVDAPCSGLGLMRRKPDIKYTKREETIQSLVDIQREILNSASEVLKVGGCLIYSTCTLTYDENQKQVAQFLKEHSNYKVEPLNWMNLPQSCYTKEGYIELLPHLYHTDGFFIAKLIKQ